MNEQTFECVMEAVCNICHSPYVVVEQDELDAICANCPAECKIRAAMEGL